MRTRAWTASAGAALFVTTAISFYLYFSHLLVPRRWRKHNRPGSIYRPVEWAPPIKNSYSRTLVVATTHDVDTSWVQRLVDEEDDFSSAVYNVDADDGLYARSFKRAVPPSSFSSSSSSSSQSSSSSSSSTAAGNATTTATTPQPPKHTLTVERSKSSLPHNKGREVMAYLTYIIDHYFSLSDVNIFLRADRTDSAVHDDLFAGDAALMSRRLQPAYVLDRGYVNLRCQHAPGCPGMSVSSSTVDLSESAKRNAGEDSASDQLGSSLSDAWDALFPFDSMPTELAQPGGGQFAVSGRQIRRVPLLDYVSYRGWLVDTALDDELAGSMWELLWQFVFTGQAALCPDERSCYCEAYGVCLGEGQYRVFADARDRLLKTAPHSS
ncbi:DUF3431 domain-containing protein [Aspergillus candidus]|uniref:Uncharacterized protein n=1 Tax=Aspergillus candidus TaxID=41067 RepID=A0A2I2FKX4_ASPCN|nr:hypothetical protein BDW47DRAFT_115443 [Aspergillus candidus]PLB41276.1 hypothetical protein BDW47DRAFT_115443 [Aspergillus candidus]